jgi:hypothetical protein
MAVARSLEYVKNDAHIYLLRYMHTYMQIWVWASNAAGWYYDHAIRSNDCATRYPCHWKRVIQDDHEQKIPEQGEVFQPRSSLFSRRLWSFIARQTGVERNK